MFTFDQFLGFIVIMGVVTMGFWLLIFLVGLLPYWIGGAVKEQIDERRNAKRNRAEINEKL